MRNAGVGERAGKKEAQPRLGSAANWGSVGPCSLSTRPSLITHPCASPLFFSSSGYVGTSDQYIDRNIQFALAAARTLVAAGRLPSARILVPDAIELRRAEKLFSTALSPGVTLGHLREAAPSGLEALARAFGGGRGGGTAPPPPAGAYLVVNASTIELPDVEAYVSSLALPAEEGGAPRAAEDLPAMVLWNMELDTLRADLGTRERGEREKKERGVRGAVRFFPFFSPPARARARSFCLPPSHLPDSFPHPRLLSPSPSDQASLASPARTCSTASSAGLCRLSTSAPAITRKPYRRRPSSSIIRAPCSGRTRAPGR